MRDSDGGESRKLLSTWPISDEIADSRIRDVLQRALRGNRPFRRFKDSLSRFPNEREQWFQYESRRRRAYIERWAHEEDIEIDFSGDVS